MPVVSFDVENAAPPHNSADNFRVTPHPNKKPRTIQDDDDDATMLSLPFGAEVDYPDMLHDTNMNDQGNDGDDGKSPDDDTLMQDGTTANGNENNNNDNKENDEWQATVDAIGADPESVSYATLLKWQDASATREQLVHRLSNVVEMFKTRRDAISPLEYLHGVYTETATQIDDSMQALLAQWQANHTRRVQLQNRLDASKQTFDANYTTLSNRVLGLEDTPPSSSNIKDDVNVNINKDPDTDGKDAIGDDGKDANTNADDTKDGDDDDNDDLDWTEVARYVPNRQDELEALWQVRQDWKIAKERLERVLQSSYEQEQAHKEQLLEFVIQVCANVDQELDEQQGAIQELLTDNLHRRQALQQALEESARKAQGLFSSLLARVTTRVSTVARGTAHMAKAPLKKLSKKKRKALTDGSIGP